MAEEINGSGIALLLALGVAATTVPFAIAKILEKKSTPPAEEPLPPECTDGAYETETQEVSCGLNGRGTIQQERSRTCVNGMWQYSDWIDTGACTDPDECTDGEEQTLRNPDGSVEVVRTCVTGHWESGMAEFVPTPSPIEEVPPEEVLASGNSIDINAVFSLPFDRSIPFRDSDYNGVYLSVAGGERILICYSKINGESIYLELKQEVGKVSPLSWLVSNESENILRKGEGLWVSEQILLERDVDYSEFQGEIFIIEGKSFPILYSGMGHIETNIPIGIVKNQSWKIIKK